jgi:hypothetical protein
MNLESQVITVTPRPTSHELSAAAPTHAPADQAAAHTIKARLRFELLFIVHSVEEKFVLRKRIAAVQATALRAIIAAAIGKSIRY